ncbi:unnamed protein product [Acanthoscelides obtectus]|uniref:Poly [ADP-ribose] polymerase 1 n=1 Tax=Acanthoscelides obtectus TaxID=200917 RepID=A0A9P0M9Y1_ACAOB|nr:unnamed protein product [Acanthoscelides obtectus]CAK1684788.1 hypothetical protein AOBTE_LOCUS35121 [Acanthoscelides obtectus]
MCRGCEQKVLKEEIRISKKDYETDVGAKYGGQDMWHHVQCFAQLRADLGFFESADKLPGFKGLSPKDQVEVKKQIPPIKQENIPEVKKIKTEDQVDSVKKGPEEEEYRKQNKIMFGYRDALAKHLDNKEMSYLLEYNDQEVPPGKDRILDRLSDIMTFGALKPCTVCKGGQLVFNKLGYICTGDLTEWSKCNTITKTPERVPFKVPDDYAEAYSFLKKYKYKPMTRVIREVKPSIVVKKDDEPDGPRVKRELPALYNMEFVIVGKLSKEKDEIKREITSLGGKVVNKISKSVMAVISTPADVEKMGSKMTDAEAEQIHVVSEDFVDEAKNNTGKIPDLIIQKSICNWGSDPSTRLPAEPSLKSKSKSKSASIYTKSVPDKMKIQIKGGTAVDPDSGLEHKAHVYQRGKDDIYSVVLSLTDIQTKRNSYYKLQLLEGDKHKKYWVFRAWGRIGTTIGGNKVEDMPDLDSAIHHFENLYEEKSGNMWCFRHNFVKVPGKMMPVELDYGSENGMENLDIVDSESKLPKPVQNLMKMIFDVDSMKQTLLEFELDTEKMPLGKLSKAQIQKAYGVLTEIQNLLNNNAPEARLIDASNRFYTFVPHSLGVDEPPLLNSMDEVKAKIEMLDNLMEIEIAYNLMKSSGSEHTVDSYYKTLNAEIQPLEKESEQFGIIQEYVKNTHAETHRSYELEIKDVFEVHTVFPFRIFDQIAPILVSRNHSILSRGFLMR